MTETIIRQLAPSVCIFSRPFKRFGIVPVGGRSTAIKLRGGDVWVLASTTLDTPTKEKIDGMGGVKYIVAADTEHDSFLSEFQKAYPQAKLIGMKPLVEKRKDLRFDGAYGQDAPDTMYGFEPEIEACYFADIVNSDVAFFHAESRSVIEADLLWNLESTKRSLWTPRFTPDSFIHKKLTQWSTSNKGETRKCVQKVLSWDFDRIIPCHGEVIETGGKEAWRAAYSAFLQ